MSHQSTYPNKIIPAITRTHIGNMAGFTITTGDAAPSEAEDIRTRDFMRLGADMGFNTVRWFNNADQMQDLYQQKRANNPNCLPTLALNLGLTPVLDTLDVLSLYLSDASLQKYLDQARLLGFAAACFNDANQYREQKNLSGLLVHPPRTLERMVDRVRKFAPSLPLFASVTGSAKAAEYKGLFDFVECQAFGTLPEFKAFLKLDCDWLCIDAQKSAKPAYLRKILALLLASGQINFFVYTAIDKAGTDWRNQPGTVKAYRTFLKSWQIPF